MKLLWGGKIEPRPWHVWLIVSGVVGVLSFVLFVNNLGEFKESLAAQINSRSLSARDIALKNLDFIERYALDENRRGEINFWTNRFECYKTGCKAISSQELAFTDISPTSPSLY